MNLRHLLEILKMMLQQIQIQEKQHDQIMLISKQLDAMMAEASGVGRACTISGESGPQQLTPEEEAGSDLH